MIETGLEGKAVIVTGGAAGIGRETARRFAAEGCRVAVWDVNEGAAGAVLTEIEEAGGHGTFLAVDVADTAAVDSAAREIVDRWGGIDVIVNNAGIVRDGQLVKLKDGTVVRRMSNEQWEAVVGINLRGVFNCTRAAVPSMIERGGGVVLNASSVVGLYGNFGQTNYVATKAGVIGMTRTWARELGRYGIRVNAVAPGFIKTEILASMPQKVLDSMVSHTPIGRMGQTADVANAYVWLASGAASFITGAVLSVDGGLVVGT
ncbi:MAG: SDR family oxidoreductase [Acidobacteria bacterium]|nr:SDR family oxidoreductase [Acidobacteriota bacterium]